MELLHISPNGPLQSNKYIHWYIFSTSPPIIVIKILNNELLNQTQQNKIKTTVQQHTNDLILVSSQEHQYFINMKKIFIIIESRA